jgi:hypothetical protein
MSKTILTYHHPVAEGIGAYYRTLLADGVPKDVAARLTIDYQDWFLKNNQEWLTAPRSGMDVPD